MEPIGRPDADRKAKFRQEQTEKVILIKTHPPPAF